jgi:hypothetical protein
MVKRTSFPIFHDTSLDVFFFESNAFADLLNKVSGTDPEIYWRVILTYVTLMTSLFPSMMTCLVSLPTGNILEDVHGKLLR